MTPARDPNRRVIPATCTIHGGPAGFCNLVVTKQPDGMIRFDPHVTGACVLLLAEDGARVLGEAVAEWLG